MKPAWKPARKVLALLSVLALAFAAPLAAQQAAPVSPGAAPQIPAPQTPAPAAPVVPAPPVSPPSVPAAPPAAPAPSGSSTAPAPAAPQAVTPSPAPAPPAVATPAEPEKGADSAGKIVEVAARPVLRVKSRSSWDDGFVSLKTALATLDAEVKKLNLATDGPMMAHFVDSDDNGFTFEALVPLKEAPAAGVTLSPGVDAALSPAGKAVEFLHEGAYDDIDSAYEAFTAWLDDKNLVSTGKFLEEYRFWPEKSDDPGMKLKITVFLK